jgi:glycine cleavage system H protein
MNTPAELKYTKDHEWIKVEGNEAYVGITDFAQGELGDIVYVDISLSGREIKQNEIFGSVEAVKTVSDLFMPVSGTIVQVNSKLETSPDLVNADPFGEGWMIKIALSDLSEIDGLLTYEQYNNFVGV